MQKNIAEHITRQTILKFTGFNRWASELPKHKMLYFVLIYRWEITFWTTFIYIYIYIYILYEYVEYYFVPV